ncbi:hypothetical protein ACMYMX_23235, partial [Salmonella enterica subsp. enterica serovar Enteritidis]|uniref:hypothetical protein n=1 Tax=Salmonella enterica TaxID=28901 RepID=UPI0039ED5237
FSLKFTLKGKTAKSEVKKCFSRVLYDGSCLAFKKQAGEAVFDLFVNFVVVKEQRWSWRRLC